MCVWSSSAQGNTMQSVCVTGAGGFIASWLVKTLLTKGYRVRGTVRNPEDGKYQHLRRLEGAEERLHLIKADILDYKGLIGAFQGCNGVFHTACPVNNNPDEVIESAVRGTENVLKACTEVGVRRLVLTSTMGAVYLNPNRHSEDIVHDDCWTDLEYCIQIKDWYCYSKTLAEKAAWKYAKEMKMDLVVVHPCLVLGPLLLPTLCASLRHMVKFLTGSAKTYANATQVYVDVRDVARAHILVYETPSASGRYVCAESGLHRGELVGILAQMFPRYPLPTKCSDEKNPRKVPYSFSNKKLRELGLQFTPIRKCLEDTVRSLEEKQLLKPMLPSAL